MKEFVSGKHIALIIRLLAGRSGGAERIYCELANILLDRGYKVTCLHYDDSDGLPFYPLDTRAERINLASRSPQKKRERPFPLAEFMWTSFGGKKERVALGKAKRIFCLPAS